MSRTFPRVEDLQPFHVPAEWSSEQVEELEAWDRSHLWKPFTQMAGYVEGKPLVIAEGRGNWLRDVHGRPRVGLGYCG